MARQLCTDKVPDYSKKNEINKASLIVYPEKKYLLTGLPEKSEMKWFWSNIIEFSSLAIVAAIMPNEKLEAEDHSLDYCQKELYPLKIDKDWTVNLLGEAVFSKSLSIENVEIIERIFILSSDSQKPRIVHHYHYQGWKNKKGAPDSALLSLLITELNDVKHNGSTVTIHCKQGRGRSGNVVLADIFYQRLLAQLVHTPLDKAKLNVAEILLQGRLMRDGFVETPEQVISAFESAINKVEMVN
jgi:protein tyrosine phosphatase